MEEIIVTMYTSADCPACEQVETDLASLQEVVPHRLVLIDVDTSSDLKTAYGNLIPVVEVGPYQLQGEIHKQDLQISLSAARDRRRQLEQVGDKGYLDRVSKGQRFTGTDRFSYWFSNSYMHIFNLAVLIYVGLPFLAAVLMKVDLAFPARVIYAMYSPLCHQLAFRSWFIFGEQPYYPRTLAEIPDVITYEQIAGDSALADLTRARRFIGNETVGYKVALCQRDVAIYGAILVFGVIFSITGRRLKPLPWYLWVVLGILPIGLDGGSQLPGLVGGLLPAWFPLRESTPLLRTITGALFGLTTAWYLYPMIEESLADTRMLLTRKLAVVASLEEKSKIVLGREEQ